MARAFTKMKGYMTEAMEKVQSQSWSEPTGKALEVTGNIVSSLGDFIPGGGIIGGALAFGGKLLNPQPSIKDLHSEMLQIKETLAKQNAPSVRRALLEEEKRIKDKIDHPEGELKQNVAEVKDDLRQLLPMVVDFSRNITAELEEIKDKIEVTFQLVTDMRYKVSIIKHVIFQLNFF